MANAMRSKVAESNFHDNFHLDVHLFMLLLLTRLIVPSHPLLLALA